MSTKAVRRFSWSKGSVWFHDRRSMSQQMLWSTNDALALVCVRACVCVWVQIKRECECASVTNCLWWQKIFMLLLTRWHFASFLLLNWKKWVAERIQNDLAYPNWVIMPLRLLNLWFGFANKGPNPKPSEKLVCALLVFFGLSWTDGIIFKLLVKRD